MNVASDTARAYIAHRSDGIVAGYHALVAGSVNREEAPERIGRGLAAHPIGVVVLARLAVTISAQGRGLGASLLQDALLRTQQAADSVEIRAVVVHVIDEMRLMLLMKDLRAFLRQS